MLRFQSDDKAHSLRVLDAESGEDLTKRLAISWGGKITLGQMITAEVELLMVQVDIVAQKSIWGTKHPVTGDYTPIKAIEFANGTRIDFTPDGTPVITPLAQQTALDVVDAGCGQGDGPDGALPVDKSPLGDDHARL